MSFPRYPKYKASGVEWLGDVPEHWAVKRLKRACQVFPSNVDKKSHEGETPVLLCNYTDVYYNEIITAGMDFMAATASSEQIEKFTLRAGDTIITKDSETADDIAIAAYVPADLPGVVCGYHLSMVRPISETDGAFIKRLFDSTYARSCFEVLANGLTRVGLGQYELDNVELPFPPMPEQTRIAEFLDRETAKIDALVAEQQRLMELLKEKRQAVISHAVTKGLNPNAPMKPSGIEWLGDVPKHWGSFSLKHIATIKAGYAFSSEDFVDEGIPVLRIGEITADGKVDFSDAKFLPKEYGDNHSDVLVTKGDIVMAMTGGTIGKAGWYTNDQPALLNQRVCIFQATKPNLQNYLWHILNTGFYTEHISLTSVGGAQPNISETQLLRCAVPVPPPLEQSAIAEYLDEESARFQSLTAEAQRAIDLLQERRTALISAAVTGQIDVRTQN